MNRPAWANVSAASRRTAEPADEPAVGAVQLQSCVDVVLARAASASANGRSGRHHPLLPRGQRGLSAPR
jgi:hypothetical protein